MCVGVDHGRRKGSKREEEDVGRRIIEHTRYTRDNRTHTIQDIKLKEKMRKELERAQEGRDRDEYG